MTGPGVMTMGFADFSLENWLTLGFYVLVILLIIIYRKKFEFQARIIALRRTKFGIKFLAES